MHNNILKKKHNNNTVTLCSNREQKRDETQPEKSGIRGGSTLSLTSHTFSLQCTWNKYCVCVHIYSLLHFGKRKKKSTWGERNDFYLHASAHPVNSQRKNSMDRWCLLRRGYFAPVDIRNANSLTLCIIGWNTKSKMWRLLYIPMGS